MTFDPEQPYNDLPPLPPGVDLETKAVLKLVIEARAALSELNQVAQRLPNPTVLISTVLLREAKFSSEIENIVTTDDELYRAASDDGKSAHPLTKEVLRYRQALWAGYSALSTRLISTNLFVEVASILKDAPMEIRRLPGTRLAGGGGRIIYTPPEGEEVIRNKLSDLERFIHGHDDLDHLVRMALIHYQFEAIHPFRDGNGRTGRIVNLLYLVERKLIDTPLLFLSGYILRNRAEYYTLLRGITVDDNWEPWLIYMLRAVKETADETSERIRRIINLMRHMSDEVRSRARGMYSRELVEAMFYQPYCRIQTLEKLGIAKRTTASRYLDKLQELGLLREERSGRNAYFVNDAFLNVLSTEYIS